MIIARNKHALYTQPSPFDITLCDFSLRVYRSCGKQIGHNYPSVLGGRLVVCKTHRPKLKKSSYVYASRCNLQGCCICLSRTFCNICYSASRWQALLWSSLYSGYPLLWWYNSGNIIRARYRPKVCINLFAALFLNRQDLIGWMLRDISKIRRFMND